MNRKRTTIFLLSALIAIGGCATPGASDPPKAGADLDAVCNPWIAGAIGAAACGLTFSKKRAGAAAACAAVAVIGCYILNSYKAEEVRSAQQVEDEYVKANRRLPDSPTLVSYDSDLDPKAAAARGEKISVKSRIVVVPGRNEKGVRVEEEVQVVDAQGEKWGKETRKPANASGQAGEYRTSFVVPVVDGMQQGMYTVKKALYLDGKSTSSQQSRFQVVEGASGPIVAWID
jgi:hypothetical protein